MPVVISTGDVVGCGQCLHCRINRGREWQHRIMLESRQHKECCFVTLTYDDIYVPSCLSLRRRDLQLFFKRLRKRYAPEKFRYYAVGEYGDTDGRPHYHVAFFGIDLWLPCFIDEYYEWGRNGTRNVKLKDWRCGHANLGFLNEDSAGYIGGYVVKGLTKDDSYSSKVLKGRPPEFSCMSNRPYGIGAGEVDAIAERIKCSGQRVKPVLSEMYAGRRAFPLGRYLQDRLAMARGASVKEVMCYELDNFNSRYGEYVDRRDSLSGDVDEAVYGLENGDICERGYTIARGRVGYYRYCVEKDRVKRRKREVNRRQFQRERAKK